MSQARRIADAEPLLHGENVLLYSEHAKKLAVILHRLPALLDLARKRVDRDAVLERLLIRDHEEQTQAGVGGVRVVFTGLNSRGSPQWSDNNDF